jgi:hypothetical protein
MYMKDITPSDSKCIFTQVFWTALEFVAMIGLKWDVSQWEIIIRLLVSMQMMSNYMIP